MRTATKLINGGYNGLEDREEYYKKALYAVRFYETIPSGVRVSLGDVYYGIGDRHEDIKVIQNVLQVTSDGKFGPNTHRAVKAFQRANGLVADGIVGPNTLEAMGIY